MKIDLHCHTKKAKSGDADTRNVNKEVFAQKIMNADVKIVAITNHNLFDYDQFKILSAATQGFCQVWPGIELDVNGTGQKRWHLIVIANPNKLDLFHESIQTLTFNKHPDEGLWTLNEIYSCLSRCDDALYIPHFHKNPGIPDEDMEELRSILRDSWRIFHDAPNYNSLSVFSDHSIDTLVGSDVQDWDKYEECTFTDLRLPVTNYEQFCLLAQRDEPVVNTLLRTKKIHTTEVSPYKDVKFNVDIYEDVNIIFGQKGTGKTEILKSIKTQLLQKGLRCQEYFGSQKEDGFKNYLMTNDMKRDPALVGAELCDSEFLKMGEWEDIQPTPISHYEKWIKTRRNNRNKSTMKITEAVRQISDNHEVLEVVEREYDIVDKNIERVMEINFDSYLSTEESLLLKSLLSKLSSRVTTRLRKELIEKSASELSNFSIDTIKSLADKKTASISKPSTTGYAEFVQKRLELLKVSQKITDNIYGKEYKEKELIGKIEEKGNLYVQKVYRMLGAKSLASEFSHKIRPLQQVQGDLEEIRKKFHAHDIITLVSSVRDLCREERITDARDFLGLSKVIVTENDQLYQPSNGEKGILLLQKALREEADAYILDEPEMGMGNSYIDSTIRPRISDLSKRFKIVVVATHNANIAVRTRPYQSVYRVHNNGQYSTYVGNPFTDELRNISDENDRKSWTQESMNTLEGGKEAFYERKVIYESGN
ncbi:hypothetical protein C7445_1278 [Alicyclobacillus sacchari]|uniref:Uncharacterized protein n=1 Tax=Alicyclobacillus sacchari TaxID=392010 RepID=A0A4R8L9D1_9BACL|nr:histidinol phosphatase [Alicyclobacillus sacchari]TDY38995.1 hypothetical protein C7445_1278 [Alicyclobacillus sacchari]GMA58083.1 hypothetical protein GCM10025858_25860 [Alicyclobacillus sacchari]